MECCRPKSNLCMMLHECPVLTHFGYVLILLHQKNEETDDSSRKNLVAQKDWFLSLLEESGVLQ